MNKCDHCICKTCAIAEINGGAPGCSDCYECISQDFPNVTQCGEYYNPKQGKISLSYLLAKAEEKRNENNNSRE